jgi:hypothetical protein
MSTPGQEFRDADYLGWGYLAITSAELLERVLAGQQLDMDDAHSLKRARQFLIDAASGAKLVQSGVPSNVSPVETVRKFSYVMEPLRLSRRDLPPPEVGKALDDMASSIDAALAAGAQADTAQLKLTKTFFMNMHHMLLDIVESGKRRTGTDFAFGASMMAQA